MTDTLVDTNVLLDVTEKDTSWFAWSSRHIADSADDGSIVVNQIIYSELAAGYASLEALDAMLRQEGFRREHVPWDAAYMAGLAFLTYRQRGGTRTSPFPDFFIGAHAAVRGYRLLTRDRGYYAKYFPTLDVISPDTHP
jgi:predicted nucleic acid-binding protein